MKTELLLQHPANTRQPVMLFSVSQALKTKRTQPGSYQRVLWPGYWMLLRCVSSFVKPGSIVIGRPIDQTVTSKDGVHYPLPPYLAGMIIKPSVKLPSAKITQNYLNAVADLISYRTFPGYAIDLTNINRLTDSLAVVMTTTWSLMKFGESLVAPIDSSPEAKQFEVYSPLSLIRDHGRQPWNGDWKLVDIINPVDVEWYRKQRELYRGMVFNEYAARAETDEGIKEAKILKRKPVMKRKDKSRKRINWTVHPLP